MRSELSGEQCVLCGTTAAVRVSGTSFCASCGLHQFSGGHSATAQPRQRRTRRAAILGLFSSGFLLKMLLGAVAVAAVGGVAASTMMQPNAPQLLSPATTLAVAPTVDSTVITTAGDATPVTVESEVESPNGDTSQRAAAEAYVAAVQEWANCVAEAASDHSGERFDPMAACPNKPSPQDHGFPANDAPGQTGEGPGNSENAPGQNKPPKDDKDK